MRGSVWPVTIPPGNFRDKSRFSGPGVGNMLKAVLSPEVRGWGRSKITSLN